MLLGLTLGTHDVRNLFPRWSLSGPLPWVYLSKRRTIPWDEYSKANGLAIGYSLLLAVQILDLQTGLSTCVDKAPHGVGGEPRVGRESEPGAWARVLLFMLAYRSPRLLNVLLLNLAFCMLRSIFIKGYGSNIFYFNHFLT